MSITLPSVYALACLNALMLDAKAEHVATSDHGALLVLVDDQPMLIAHREGVRLDEVGTHRWSIMPGAESEFARIAREIPLH
jgi:hypothetical protein